MRLRDIDNQNGKWVHKCEVHVLAVGEPEQSEFGYCQVIDIKDGQGVCGCLNVFLDDLAGMVTEGETGVQYYDVRLKKDKGYYQGKPCDAPPKIKEAPVYEAPNWEQINLGKCRHGILVAMIHANVNIHELGNGKYNALINKLARFSMTGEIE